VKRTTEILPFISLDVRAEKDIISNLSPNETNCYFRLGLEQWSKSIDYFFPLPDDNSSLASICRITKQKFESIRPNIDHLLTKSESGLSVRGWELLWNDVKKSQEQKRLAGSKGGKATQSKNKAILEAPLKQLESKLELQSELQSNKYISSSKEEVPFESSLWNTNMNLVKNRIWEQLHNRKGSMYDTCTALCELEEEGVSVPSTETIVAAYNEHCEEVASTNNGSYQYCKSLPNFIRDKLYLNNGTHIEEEKVSLFNGRGEV
tara:strand:+ start:1054 stop:1842 length:789 start_codon:yes stop_codon:yes gene_type:complete